MSRKTIAFCAINGEVKRQNRSLLKAMRLFQAAGKDWRLELNKFPLAYRSTSHTTTAVSPAGLFFKRKLTTKLPEFTDGGESQMGVALQQVRDRGSKKKKQAKHAKDKAIVVGDAVLLEEKIENKLSPSYESRPYEVTARYKDQVVLKSPQGVEYKRNLQHIKCVVTEPVTDAECSAESGSDTPEPVPSPGLTDCPLKRPHLQEWKVRVLRVAQEELASLQMPWLIMYFTEHFRICFHEGNCLSS